VRVTVRQLDSVGVVAARAAVAWPFVAMAVPWAEFGGCRSCVGLGWPQPRFARPRSRRAAVAAAFLVAAGQADIAAACPVMACSCALLLITTCACLGVAAAAIVGSMWRPSLPPELATRQADAQPFARQPFSCYSMLERPRRCRIMCCPSHCCGQLCCGTPSGSR
jgi:hypothetical protein